MEPPPGEITRLLQELRDGNREAEAKLVPLVYDELHRLAAAYMRRERPDHTLQPTALVHEAYLRLAKERKSPWSNRADYYGAAARVMRHILVDHARKRLAGKRPPPGQRVHWDEVLDFSEERSREVVAVDGALKRLTELDPPLSRLVELRFFIGVSVEETAELLGSSTRQVKRDWSAAKAWMRGQIGAKI